MIGIATLTSELPKTVMSVGLPQSAKTTLNIKNTRVIHSFMKEIYLMETPKIYHLSLHFTDFKEQNGSKTEQVEMAILWKKKIYLQNRGVRFTSRRQNVKLTELLLGKYMLKMIKCKGAGRSFALSHIELKTGRVTEPLELKTGRVLS